VEADRLAFSSSSLRSLFPDLSLSISAGEAPLLEPNPPSRRLREGQARHAHPETRSGVTFGEPPHGEVVLLWRTTDNNSEATPSLSSPATLSLSLSFLSLDWS
jgi:hypothetical protein